MPIGGIDVQRDNVPESTPVSMSKDKANNPVGFPRNQADRRLIAEVIGKFVARISNFRGEAPLIQLPECFKVGSTVCAQLRHHDWLGMPL